MTPTTRPGGGLDNMAALPPQRTNWNWLYAMIKAGGEPLLNQGSTIEGTAVTKEHIRRQYRLDR